MEQPFFDVQSVSTQVKISNGATVLLGGGTVNKKGDKSVYVFLSSRLVDENGEHRQLVPSGQKVAKPEGWHTTFVPGDPTKVAVVKTIFAEFLDGKSPWSIVKQLNDVTQSRQEELVKTQWLIFYLE